MDRTNLVMISTDDITELDGMFGTEQDMLDMYNEMLSCNDEEPEHEYNEQVERYARECAEDYYLDFLAEWGDEEVLCIADLGLWYGRRDGGKSGKLRDLLSDAIEDFNTLWFDKENQCFVLQAIHHDGTNYYRFYGLSEKGKSYLNNHPRCAEVHQHILNTKGYTKQIRYC